MHLCNAPLPQVWAESGGWLGLVGELITINFPEVVGFVTFEETKAQIQERLDRMPALIFPEYYRSV